MTSNTLGALGLALIVVALAALFGPWWAMLAAGAALLALAYVRYRWEQHTDDPVEELAGLTVEELLELKLAQRLREDTAA